MKTVYFGVLLAPEQDHYSPIYRGSKEKYEQTRDRLLSDGWEVYFEGVTEVPSLGDLQTKTHQILLKANDARAPPDKDELEALVAAHQ